MGNFQQQTVSLPDSNPIVCPFMEPSVNKIPGSYIPNIYIYNIYIYINQYIWFQVPPTYQPVGVSSPHVTKTTNRRFRDFRLVQRKPTLDAFTAVVERAMQKPFGRRTGGLPWVLCHMATI